MPSLSSIDLCYFSVTMHLIILTDTSILLIVVYLYIKLNFMDKWYYPVRVIIPHLGRKAGLFYRRILSFATAITLKNTLIHDTRPRSNCYN